MPTEPMTEASEKLIAILQAKMAADPQFATALTEFAKLLKQWYAQAGYKLVCRWLISLVR